MAATAHHEHDHDAYAPADEWESGPAKIKTVAKRYEGELARRFRRVRNLVQATVEEHDALRVGDTRMRRDAFAAPVRDFEFTDDASKEAAFREWFDSALRDEVLEPVGEQRLLEGEHYTAKYVRGSYQGGMRHAGREMQDIGMDVSNESIGISFNAPIHREQARVLFRRNFSALEGLNDATGKEVSRVLTEGLARGEGPEPLASELTDRIDDYGITNARVTTRTELARSYTHGAATRYEQHGVGKVEILTHQPCSICEELAAGGPYPVEEARGLIPGRTHPQCVCSISPLK